MYAEENFKENNRVDNVSKVAIGYDHGGFISNEIVKKYLEVLGFRVVDLGTYSEESVDYPDFAVKVAQSVASGETDLVIMIDGAGIGSSMVCNKFRGIRTALCYDIKTIKNSRLHKVDTKGGASSPKACLQNCCQYLLARRRIRLRVYRRRVKYVFLYQLVWRSVESAVVTSSK